LLHLNSVRVHPHSAMGGFLVDGGLWWLLVHSSPISNHHLITWEINLHGDCSNVPPAATGACTSVFSIELFLINNFLIFFVCLFIFAFMGIS